MTFVVEFAKGCVVNTHWQWRAEEMDLRCREDILF